MFEEAPADTKHLVHDGHEQDLAVLSVLLTRLDPGLPRRVPHRPHRRHVEQLSYPLVPCPGYPPLLLQAAPRALMQRHQPRPRRHLFRVLEARLIPHLREQHARDHLADHRHALEPPALAVEHLVLLAHLGHRRFHEDELLFQGRLKALMTLPGQLVEVGQVTFAVALLGHHPLELVSSPREAAQLALGLGERAVGVEVLVVLADIPGDEPGVDGVVLVRGGLGADVVLELCGVDDEDRPSLFDRPVSQGLVEGGGRLEREEDLGAFRDAPGDSLESSGCILCLEGGGRLTQDVGMERGLCDVDADENVGHESPR